MDGPQIGGGGGIEIASAYATVGADLSPLRAAEEEAKQIMARLGAMGGGTIGNPGSGGAMGGITISAKIDESGLRQQIDGFFRGLSIRLPVELDIKGGDRLAGGGTSLSESLVQSRPSVVIASNPQPDLRSFNSPVIASPNVTLAQPTVSIMQSAPPAALMPTPESRAAVIASAVGQVARSEPVHLAGGTAIPTSPAPDAKFPAERVVTTPPLPVDVPIQYRTAQTQIIPPTDSAARGTEPRVVPRQAPLAESPAVPEVHFPIERVTPTQAFPPDVVPVSIARSAPIPAPSVTIDAPVANPLLQAAIPEIRTPVAQTIGLTRELAHGEPVGPVNVESKAITASPAVDTGFPIERISHPQFFPPDVVSAEMSKSAQIAPPTVTIAPPSASPLIPQLPPEDYKPAIIAPAGPVRGVTPNPIGDTSLPTQRSVPDGPIASPAPSQFSQDFTRLERPITNVAVSARADQEALYNQAKRAGVVNEIASQYVVEKRKPIDIPHPPEVIEAVRNKLGIPSQFEPGEFHEFRQRVMNEGAGPLAVDPARSTWLHSPTEIHPSESRWLNAPARGTGSPLPENPVHGAGESQISHQLGAAAQALLQAANAIGAAVRGSPAPGSPHGLPGMPGGSPSPTTGGPPSIASVQAWAAQQRGGRGFNPGRLSSLSEEIGVPLAGLWAANEVMRVAGGFSEAEEIRSHPERILRSHAQIGSSFDVMANPIMQAASRGMANAQANQKEWQAIESIPLLGGAVSFVEQITGIKGGLDDREYNANRAIQLSEFAHIDIEKGRMESAAKFGPTAAMREQLSIDQEKLKIAQAETAKAKWGMTASPHLSTDWNSLKRDGVFRVTIDPESMAHYSAAKEAEKAIAADVENAKVKLKATEEQEAASFGVMTGGTTAARLVGESIDIQRSRAPGSILSSLSKSQEAERIVFDRTAEKKIADIPEENQKARDIQGGLSDEERRTLLKRQAKQTEDVQRNMALEIQSVGATGDAALALSRGDTFESQRIKFEDSAVLEREKFKGASQADQDRLESSLAKQRDAMNQGQARAVASIGISVNSIGLAAAGDQRGAKLEDFNAQLAALGPDDPQRRLIEARRNAFVITDARDVAAESFGMETRSRVAGDLIKDAPTAARAESEVGRARSEYDRITRTTTDPARLKQARDALSEELKASQHELLGQRGGEVAIDMSLANAVAIPAGLDLSGAMRDRKLAGDVLAKGIADVQAGKPLPKDVPVVPAAPPAVIGGVATAHASAGGDGQMKADKPLHDDKSGFWKYYHPSSIVVGAAGEASGIGDALRQASSGKPGAPAVITKPGGDAGHGGDTDGSVATNAVQLIAQCVKFLEKIAGKSGAALFGG